jgi:hypothetical protein
VEADDSGIVPEEDAITGSLFRIIKERDSGINVLIGAKKFMEGWNSWRVSNMGLLNIGIREGSEIIQLFGRGVRLRGRDFSLKRSSVLDGQHPDHVGLLETLNIFAVRANYMTRFRDYLEREGMPVEGDVELPLAIRANRKFLKEGLVVPRVPDGRDFAQDAALLLAPEPTVHARVDLSMKVQALESGPDGMKSADAREGRAQTIPSASLDLVDWEAAYLDLLDYKERKGMTNLAVQPDALKRIFTTTSPAPLYSLVADDSMVKPRTFASTALLQEAVSSVLRQYADRYYRIQQRRWESAHMEYAPIDAENPNFQDYTVKIARGETKLISAVEKLIKEGTRLYDQESRELPQIHFDRHLYQPLLIEAGDKLKSVPPGLNLSEKRFVEDLRGYCRDEAGKSLAETQLFLLRNLSRGKGVGFFQSEGFYPDFILWIKNQNGQRIVFIEPHGMLHAPAPLHDEKANLHVYLSKLSSEIEARTKLSNVMLDSYIVSATPFEDLRKTYGDGAWDLKRFADAHIVFPEAGKSRQYLASILGAGYS